MTQPSATPTQKPWVDAHHHLWNLDLHPHYPWLSTPNGRAHFGDYRALQVNYTIDRYLNDMKGTALVKSVHCEAGWGGADPVLETRWLQAIGDAHGFPNALIVPCRLEHRDNERDIERHLQYSRVRGVRQLLFNPANVGSGDFSAGAKLEDPRWLQGFSRLAAKGLSFDLQAVPTMMSAVEALARGHPGTSIIVTHLGLPVDRSPTGLTMWQQGLELVATCPNVSIKLSGLPMTDWHWTPSSIAPLVDVALDAFGPDRVMVGSNFPVDSLHAQAGELIAAYRASIRKLTQSEQTLILSSNAERLYRI